MGASGSEAALWKRHRFLMYKISPPSRSYGRKAPVTPKEEIHLIMTHLFLAPMQQLVENHIFIDFHRNLEDILKNFVNLSRWNVNKNLLKQAPTCKELVKSEAITKAIIFFSLLHQTAEVTGQRNSPYLERQANMKNHSQEQITWSRSYWNQELIERFQW